MKATRHGTFIVVVLAAIFWAVIGLDQLALVTALAAAVVWVLVATSGKSQPDRPVVPTTAERIERLRDELDFFRDYENQYQEAVPSGFVFKRDEHVIAMVSGAALVESRRGPAQFKGGSLGLSLRVTDRVSVRPTGFRGKSIPGEEAPTVIDEGSFVITDQRGIFVGSKQSREFDWSKLLSYQVVEMGKDALILYLPVSGRQKVSGIGCDEKAMREIEQRVGFAVAVTTGRRDAFIALIEEELRSLEAESGSTTDSLPPPSV